MHVLNLTYLGVLAAAFSQFAQGTPFVGQLPKRDVPCDPISKYTVDVLIPPFPCHYCLQVSNVRNNQYFMGTKIYEPPGSTCLFYTAWLSAIAQRFAHGGGSDMTTLWVSKKCHRESIMDSNYEGYLAL